MPDKTIYDLDENESAALYRKRLAAAARHPNSPVGRALRNWLSFGHELGDDEVNQMLELMRNADELQHPQIDKWLQEKIWFPEDEGDQAILWDKGGSTGKTHEDVGMGTFSFPGLDPLAARNRYNKSQNEQDPNSVRRFLKKWSPYPPNWDYPPTARDPMQHRIEHYRREGDDDNADALEELLRRKRNRF